MAGVLTRVLAPSSEADGRLRGADGRLSTSLRGLISALRDRIDGLARSEPDRGEPASGEPVRMDGFPERSRPLTVPCRDRPDINPTDVIGVEMEEGLRLSVPENPDAEIISDVWVAVPR